MRKENEIDDLREQLWQFVLFFQNKVQLDP